jgi:hypothetical protein
VVPDWKGAEPGCTSCPSVHDIEALVVSHFHADHWGGLYELGRRSGSERHGAKGNGDSLTIFYPGMPEVIQDLEPAVFYLQALAGALPQPFTAISLADVWAAAGRRPVPRALRRGQSVELAGVTFQVLWPPRHMPAGRAQSLHDALNIVRAHACEDRELGDWFRKIQGSPFGRGRPDQPPGVRDPRPIDDAVDLELDVETDDDDVWTLDADDWTLHLPPDLIEVVKEVQKWSNDMSLVLSAEDASLLAMGDISSVWALRSALNGAKERYKAMLAPHHGTHGDLGLPRAGVCFMQTGHQHSERTKRHRSQHVGVEHICTHTSTREGVHHRQDQVCPEDGCEGHVGGNFFRRWV